MSSSSFDIELITKLVDSNYNLLHYIVDLNKEIMELNNKLSISNLLETFDNTCTACNKQERSVVILPCKHFTTCLQCMDRYRLYHDICPICNTKIENILVVYN